MPTFDGFFGYNGNAVYAQVFSQLTDRLAVLAGVRQDWQTNDGKFNGDGEPVSADQSIPTLRCDLRTDHLDQIIY